MLDTYKNILSKIEKGMFEDASNDLLDFKKSNKNIYYLLSSRLSLKIGSKDINYQTLKDLNFDDPFYQAELNFVLGLWNYQNQNYVEGKDQFKAAKDLYQDQYRSKLSAFNELIGVSELGRLTDNLLITSLECLMEDADTKIQSFCNRQISYVLYDQEKYNLSLEYAHKAKQYFKINGPLSDFHLLCCHISHLYHCLNDTENALLYLERVIPPIDSRVEFPYEFLNNLYKGIETNIHQFNTINSYWKKRLLTKTKDSKIAIWNTQESTIIIESDSYQLKLNSMEGKLIKILNQDKRTKNLLMQFLWPDINQYTQVENRLHKLISRINKKIDKTITFDGSYYSLTHKILIK